MELNIDEDTGLPELPEGYFWRVKESVGDYLRVQIRKKTLFRSTVEAWSAVRKPKATREEIQRTAVLVMMDFKVGGNWKKYLGDYPPKKLGE